jgi:hypothetical protein
LIRTRESRESAALPGFCRDHQQFRVRFTANNGDTARLQLAEIQMFADGGCTPESDATFCSRQGKNCGSFTGTDNCGASRTANCGTCTAPATCGGGGTANVCGGGSGTCSPTITNMSLAKCNDTFVFTDNKLYKCISQDVGVNGSTACGTSGVRCSQIAPNDPAWGTTAWPFIQTCN